MEAEEVNKKEYFSLCSFSPPLPLSFLSSPLVAFQIPPEILFCRSFLLAASVHARVVKGRVLNLFGSEKGLWPSLFSARGKEERGERGREVERGRRWFDPPPSLLPSLLPLLLLLLSFLFRAFLQRSPTVLQINPCRKTPKFDPSCTRSLLFFVSSSKLCRGGALSLVHSACRRLSRKKKQEKKPNHNARSLHDLGRPRAAESRRGGPDGPRRGSAVSVGGHGGGAEQGRDGRERSIEASQSLSEKSKLPPRSSRSSGRRRRKKKSFIFCSVLLSECPARTT